MNLKQVFGKNVKYYRFQKKITQSQLAEKIGVSDVQISRIETGICGTEFEIIEKICKTLNIQPFQLFVEPKSLNLPRRVDMK